MPYHVKGLGLPNGQRKTHRPRLRFGAKLCQEVDGLALEIRVGLGVPSQLDRILDLREALVKRSSIYQEPKDLSLHITLAVLFLTLLVRAYGF